jgi:hypothetical protein
MSNTLRGEPYPNGKAVYPSWAYGFESYDGLEIGPVNDVSEEGDGTEYAACHPECADMWAVYGHCRGGGVVCLEGFCTQAEAYVWASAALLEYPCLQENGLRQRWKY